MNINKYVRYLVFSLTVLSIIFIFIFFIVVFPLKYKKDIVLYSNKNGLEPSFVCSVICAESSFNKNAISDAGAVGLMQIMPTTALWVCEKMGIDYNYNNLFEPSYNINIGTYYLNYLIEKFNDKDVALCAYNAGEGVVRSWLKNEKYSNDNKTLKIIPYAETNRYVLKIKNCVKMYSFRI